MVVYKIDRRGEGVVYKSFSRKEYYNDFWTTRPSPSLPSVLYTCIGLMSSMYKIDRSKFVYVFHIEHMNKAGHVAAAPSPSLS